jgi:MarR family 2-MHQ and catechol resistance regulon transcriptional repressor
MPTHYKGTPKEVLALDTFIKLTRATDSFSNRLSQYGMLENLTVTQFGVLETLHHLGPLCQNEIGTKLLKSNGNISLVLENLEKNGLVWRERNPQDRRMVTVNLTQKGQELISRIFPNQVKAITEEMGVLSPSEQETLGNLCRKLGKKKHPDS